MSNYFSNKKPNYNEGLSNNSNNSIKWGFHQWLNFGKYNKKTVYDIANLGDYKYLQWLSSPKKSTFQLSEPFLIHVEHALKTMNTDAKWEKCKSDCNYDDTYYVYYFTYVNNKRIESPSIEMKKCKVCNYGKNISTLENDVCYKCRTNYREKSESVPPLFRM